MTKKDSRFMWAVVLGLGVFLSVVWYANFEINQIDKAQDLTFMKAYRDPALYPRSFLFLQICPILLSSVYYWIIGFLGTLFDPYWTLYACFIAINCFFLAGLFHLALKVTRDLTASFLSVVALTLQWQLAHALGGSGPLGLAPGQLHLASALLLFSISLFLSRRHVLAFALAGLAFDVHASFAIFVSAMFAVSLLARGLWKELGKGAAVAAVAALPMFLRILGQLLSAKGGGTIAQWHQLIILRSAHHTMPFHFELDNYVRFLPYPVLFFLGCRMARAKTGGTAAAGTRDLALLAAGILLLCLIGTVFSEIVPVIPVIQLTLFRSTRFLVIFSVFLYFASAVPSFRLRDARDFVHVGLMAGVISASFPAVYAALTGLCLLALRKRGPWLAAAAGTALCAGSLGILYYACNRYGFPMVLRQSNLHLFLAALSVLTAYAFLVERKRNPSFPKQVFLAPVALIVLLAPLYPIYQDRGYFAASKDLQIWLKTNTPSDQPVVLPPTANVWSGLSERGDTFTFNEVAYQIYVPHLQKEVAGRSKDYVEDPLLFHDGEALKKAMIQSYDDWDEAKFQAVGAKYGSDFAVVNRGKKLHFPLVYENESFRVYKIR